MYHSDRTQEGKLLNPFANSKGFPVGIHEALFSRMQVFLSEYKPMNGDRKDDPCIYTHLHFLFKQGDIYFDYYEDMNFFPVSLQNETSRIISNPEIVEGAVVEYPYDWNFTPKNANQELLVLVTLKDGIDFDTSIMALLRSPL